jgi:ABC-2 type transport system permease protein
VHKVAVIAKRELASYFNAPVAYIVIVTFLLVAGWMFFSGFFLTGRADLRQLFAPSPFSPSMLLVIIAPAVTMRLIAEERKSGTIELISTMPVRKWEIVVGKFLAAYALLSIAILSTLVYAITVAAIGQLDWGPVVGGYFGLLLFAGALSAIGLLCSSLTQNQIVAFIVGFIICAVLYFVFWLQFFVPTSVAPVVEFVSVSSHLESLARGVIDTRNVVYYLSLIAGALFLAMRVMSRQRA